jgi:hypothetical protein
MNVIVLGSEREPRLVADRRNPVDQMASVEPGCH